MSGGFDDDELWNYFGPKKVQPPEQDPVPLSSPRKGDAASQNEEPKSGQPPWRRSREGDAAPQNATPESVQAPWKRSKGHRPFAGDVVAELRKKALAPNWLSDPPAPSSRAKCGIVVPFAGLAVVMTAGIVGYELSSGPPARRPRWRSPGLADVESGGESRPGATYGGRL
jgi:hypothetical protein